MPSIQFRLRLSQAVVLLTGCAGVKGAQPTSSTMLPCVDPSPSYIQTKPTTSAFTAALFFWKSRSILRGQAARLTHLPSTSSETTLPGAYLFPTRQAYLSIEKNSYFLFPSCKMLLKYLSYCLVNKGSQLQSEYDTLSTERFYSYTQPFGLSFF